MVEEDEKNIDARKRYELLKRKRTTLEYNVLELCGYVLQSLDERMTADEGNIDRLAKREIGWSIIQSDKDSEREVGILLRYIMDNGLLETALKNAGVNDELEIKAAIDVCRQYIDQTVSLYARDMRLSDMFLQKRYKRLMTKVERGERLTPEDSKELDHICDILSADH